MPKEADIPAELDPAIIKQAIAEFTPDVEGFGPSSTYDLVYEGERYPPKAILGIALRNHTGDPTWDHNSFNGGENSKCFKVLQKAGFVIEEKPEASQIQSPTLWWVNQRTYKEERQLSLIWAPKENEDGKTFYHWENVGELKKGDIVFHYNSNTNFQSIVSISIALSDSHDSPKPEKLKGNWTGLGWKVDLGYHDLNQPITKPQIRKAFEIVQTEKYQPINSAGNANQGYLYKIHPKAVNELIGVLVLSELPEELKAKFIAASKGIHKTSDQETDSNMSDTTTGAWTFQFSQDNFRREAFSNLSVIFWSVKTNKNKIKDGDSVYIWQTKGVGVIAHGTIQGSAKKCPCPPEQQDYWIGNAKLNGSKVVDRVAVKIHTVLKDPISKEVCLQNAKLEKLKCITAMRATIYDVTPEQHQELQALIGSPVTTEPPYTIEDALTDLFLSRDNLENILKALTNSKNVILQGPPGVGKTYVAKRLAYAAIGAKSDTRVQMIQFHQSYSYEDFIQGYRPSEDKHFTLKNGVFYNFCKTAQANPSQNHVFIIDEINRGNLSKIFGELMMLIERDKRSPEYSIPLTYSEDLFHVPPNVHLLGLMNTADRSLAMVDYALRRRFKFFSLQPEFSQSFTDFLVTKGVDSATINKLVQKIGDLNKAIGESRDLGDGFQVGHSYFCSTNGYSSGEWDQWLQDILDTEILPLLQEYWVDDSEELQKHTDKLLG